MLLSEYFYNKYKNYDEYLQNFKDSDDIDEVIDYLYTSLENYDSIPESDRYHNIYKKDIEDEIEYVKKEKNPQKIISTNIILPHTQLQDMMNVKKFNC